MTSKCKRCGAPSEAYRCAECNEAHRKERNQAKSFCGYCGVKGHNKRACAALAADRERIRSIDAKLLSDAPALLPDKHPDPVRTMQEEITRLRKEVKRLTLEKYAKSEETNSAG